MEKQIVNIINQLNNLESKLEINPDKTRLIRNIKGIKSSLNELGYSYHNPILESYNETRLDCEADIIGNEPDDLYISDVIKPIIFKNDTGGKIIVQKAIVIAQPKNT